MTIPIIKAHSNVKFFAVSNVESKNDLIEFLEKLPTSVKLYPKLRVQLRYKILMKFVMP